MFEVVRGLSRVESVAETVTEKKAKRLQDETATSYFARSAQLSQPQHGAASRKYSSYFYPSRKHFIGLEQEIHLNDVSIFMS